MGLLNRRSRVRRPLSRIPAGLILVTSTRARRAWLALAMTVASPALALCTRASLRHRPTRFWIPASQPPKLQLRSRLRHRSEGTLPQPATSVHHVLDTIKHGQSFCRRFILEPLLPSNHRKPTSPSLDGIGGGPTRPTSAPLSILDQPEYRPRTDVTYHSAPEYCGDLSAAPVT